MKISKETLNILKSFSAINNSIYLESSVIVIKDENSSVFAHYEAEEDFVIGCGIFDLNKFLRLTNKFSDPDFIIDENFITIKEGKKKVKYRTHESELIEYAIPPSKDIELDDDDVIESFILSKSDLSDIKNFSKELRVDEDSLVVFDFNQENGIKIKISHPHIDDQEFVIDIKEKAKINAVFSLSIDNFNFLQLRDYKVNIFNFKDFHVLNFVSDKLYYILSINQIK